MVGTAINKSVQAKFRKSDGHLRGASVFMAASWLACGTALAAEDVVVSKGETVRNTIELEPGQNLTIESGGTVVTTGSGVDGVVATANGTTIVNNGKIATIGNDTFAAVTTGDGATIINYGEISATGNEATGIAGRGEGSTVINHGEISATGIEPIGMGSDGAGSTVINYGEVSARGRYSVGLFIEGDARAVNTGTIYTHGDEAFGIYADGKGASAYVYNGGTVSVTGSGSYAIYLAGENSELVNGGALSATGENSHAIYGDEYNQVVTLTEGSRITGAIDLGGGDDTLNYRTGYGPSEVLSVQGVDTLHVDDSLTVLTTQDGATTVISKIDPTGPSVLNEAAADLSNHVHGLVAGRFVPGIAGDGTKHATAGSQTGSAGVWVSVFGALHEHGVDGATLAYRHGLTGAMAGYDRDLGAARAGLLAGASSGHLETSDVDALDTEIGSAFLGAYANLPAGRLNLTTSVLAGIESYGNERLVYDNLSGAETAEADIANTFVSASLGADGSLISYAGFDLRSAAIVNYTASFFDGYTETGTVRSNLTVDDRTAQTLNTRAQLSLGYAIGMVDLRLRSGIDRRFSYEDEVHVSLNGSDLSFHASDSENSLMGFVGASARLARHSAVDMSGDIEYRFGEGDETALAASVNFSFEF